MPRLARKDLNTPFLHVMVQGVNKEEKRCGVLFRNRYQTDINEYIENGIKEFEKQKKFY